MKISPIVASGALLMLLSSASFAQNHKSTLNKAGQYVTRAESAIKRANGILDKSQESNGQILDSAIQSATNQFDDAVGHLEKANNLLKSVPDGESGKDAVQKNYNAAKSSLDALQNRLKGANSVIEQADKTNAAGAANDQTTVDAVSDLLDKFRVDCRSDKPDIAAIDLWPQTRKDTEALIAKYGTKGSRGENREFSNKVQSLKSTLAYIDLDLKNVFNKRQIEAITAHIKNLKLAVDNAVSGMTFGAFRTTIPDHIDTLERRIHVYQKIGPAQPGYDASLVEKVKSAIAGAKAEAAKLYDKIIASNEMFPDAYTGSDKEALRSAIKAKFAAKFPKAKILKIVLHDPAFVRFTAWKWSDDLYWYKEDYSSMGSSIFIAGEDPKYAYIFPAPIIRDHLQGGAQRIAIPGAIGKPGPESMIFASKVK